MTQLPTTASVPAPDQPKKRFPLGWAIRVFGSAIVLGITFWLLPTQQVWTAVRALPGGVWVSSLALFLAGHVACAFKWRILIGGGIAPRQALAAHFAGLVANLSLPGAAGGDVVRAGWVLSQAEDKAQVALGSLADRVIDTLSLFVLACIGGAFAVAYGSGVGATLGQMGLFLVLALVGGALALFVLLRMPLPAKVRRIIDKLQQAFDSLRKRPLAILTCFLMSISVQAVFVCVNILLANASGLHVVAAGWFFAWPLAKLLAVAPVSIGGLGVREASLAALLSPLGAPPAQVVAVGLVWQSILFASGFLGAAVLYVLPRLARKVIGISST